MPLHAAIQRVTASECVLKYNILMLCMERPREEQREGKEGRASRQRGGRPAGRPDGRPYRRTVQAMHGASFYRLRLVLLPEIFPFL